MPVKALEIGGFPADPWLSVDQCLYRVGDSLEGRHGFELFEKLTERLLRVVVYLALARKLDPDPEGGWIHAERIAITADDMKSPAATKKFLERHLRGYTPDLDRELAFTQIPAGHLVQYRPRRKTDTGVANGRSQGPYRLGVAPESITLDAERALAFLGHSTVLLPAPADDLEAALTRAQGFANDGDYLSARALIMSGLLYGHHRTTGKQFQDLAARAYYHLGHFNMQLGLPREAILYARRARRLFKLLRDPGWVTSVLVTESHGESQLGNTTAALATAKHARTALDDVDRRRRKWMRTGRVGVVGQRYSRVGNFSAAERNLLYALRLAEEIDDKLKIYTWTLRRTENFMEQNSLGAAEQSLSEAHDLHARFAITGVEGAILWRVTARFMVAAGRSNEAAEWANRATDFALRHGLGNELRSLAPTIAKLEDRGIIHVPE